MHFKTKNKSLFIIAFSLSTGLVLNGCGIGGNVNLPISGAGGVGEGCLNNSKNLMSRFTTGDMSQTEWKAAFNCINDSLTFFTQYVHGSTQSAYSQADMYTLISKFLVTNATVHSALMQGAFSLKAALFGGSTQEFTTDEVALLQTSLVRLRDITSDLIPFLQVQKNPNPSFADLLGLVSAFQTAGEQLSDYINTLPVGSMSSQAMNVLLTELSTTLNFPLDPSVNGNVFLGKWIIFNTRKDALEAADWGLLFKTAMGAGGIYLAYQAAVGTDVTAPQHQVMDRLHSDYRFREFIYALAIQAKPYLNTAITNHNGAIPFPLFDELIENLTGTTVGLIPKAILEQSMRPLLRKLFKSTTKVGVDQSVLDTLYGLLDTWVTTAGQLDRMYEQTGINRYSVTPQVLINALDQYGSSLTSPSDKANFAAMRSTIASTNASTGKTQLTYPALLFSDPVTQTDTVFIKYQPNVGYSFYQNFTVMTLNTLINHLLKTYGTGPGYFLVADFQAIFADYTPILFAEDIVDATVANFGAKRFQDIDLFTPVSDGNQQVSLQEITHYALMIMSATTLGTKMHNEITCNEDLGQDIMGWNWVSAGCFRGLFNDRLDYWLTYFPRLKAYWMTLTPAQKTQAMIWLEHGARRNGYNDDEFGKFDFGAMATVLNYTESLFTRFDVNFDENLEKSEINTAYPVFKLLLAQKANMSASDDYLIKGFFSYIVKYRAMPATDSLGNILDLGWWLAIYTLPTTDYQADRLGVFNIVCQLAAPESASQQAATATICK